MIEIFSALFGVVKTWAEGKRELAKAELDTKLAAQENAARLLRDTNSNNHAWEMAQLTDSDKWLRRICFVIFFFPLIWAWFSPDAVQTYFDITLDTLPTWYLQTVLAICGAIWGISSLKAPITQLLSRK